MEFAAVVVTPILEELTKKLGSAIWKELGLLWGVKGDLKKLESLFFTVSVVLEDAERRPISDRALQKWLKDLKDAAFDADDVLDEFQTEAMWRMKVHNTVTGKVVISNVSCCIPWWHLREPSSHYLTSLASGRTQSKMNFVPLKSGNISSDPCSSAQRKELFMFGIGPGKDLFKEKHS